MGCPGSGKSTFARQLRDITGLPLHYLDMIWHLPDRTTVPEEVFDRRLLELAAGERWIIDGNYRRTIELRLRACDAVFLFDLPAEDCLAGAMARVGRRREDMPWVEEALDDEFRQWILDFPQDQLPVIYEHLSRYGEGREITVFRSRREAETYLDVLACRREFLLFRGGKGGMIPAISPQEKWTIWERGEAYAGFNPVLSV